MKEPPSDEERQGNPSGIPEWMSSHHEIRLMSWLTLSCSWYIPECTSVVPFAALLCGACSSRASILCRQPSLSSLALNVDPSTLL